MTNRTTGNDDDGPRNAGQGTYAVQRAIRILACFSVERPLVSLAEFAEEAGLTGPAARQIVNALERRGYLVRNDHTRLYSLGPMVTELAQVILQRDTPHELIRLALPQLEALRDLTEETAA